MYPLALRADPVGWRMFLARKGDKSFRAFKQKVLLRDNYTCQFCGFQARDYQEVVNLDHNYRNNKLSNLVTSCVFCAQCFFMESAGVDESGGGTVIYLPEIPQSDLNSLCHVLFCAITNETGYKSSAQTIYRSFKFRLQIVENKFGEGSSHPAPFGQLLADYSAQQPDADQSFLSDLRLLPSRGRFKKQIERWAASALDEISSEF